MSTNAAYCKNYKALPFDKANPKVNVFYGENEVTVEMMHQESGFQRSKLYWYSRLAVF